MSMTFAHHGAGDHLTFGQAYFVHQFESQNLLTPNSVLVLFIVSVLAAAWAIATVLRRKSTRDSAIFVSFIDLCFIGAFIAGVYELRYIANANCTNFSADSHFSVTVDNNGISGSSPFHLNTDKHCAMLKASFAFGIMNCIFFAITSFLLLFMHRKRDDRDVVVKESYRRRSHDSRPRTMVTEHEAAPPGILVMFNLLNLSMPYHGNAGRDLALAFLESCGGFDEREGPG
ncbi:MAG: hypothetical protein L6R39_000475 [Caloplaca ligustica]|nr:MAG: hypothetical protein L6R39_000475 [Caloplaca ligustica]